MKRSPASALYRALTLLASLKLTVGCLFVGMILIFLATLAQVHLGIYEAQSRYFATWLVWGEWGKSGISLPYLPGGYAVGGILILNLLCAHWKRFRARWNKMGLLLIHLGILILLIGGFVTHWLSHEGQLIFNEGESKSFYESFQEKDMVVSEILPRHQIRETVFPVKQLKAGKVLEGDHLPFALRIADVYPNTRLTIKRAMGDNRQSSVNRGWGQRLNAEPVKETFKPKEQNLISVFVELVWNDQVLGTWLMTNAVSEPQWVEVEGRRFAMELRRKRYYLPFDLTLEDFSHDRYPGTDIAKNFSSRVRVKYPKMKENREVLIYMNHPLRYEGKTFFQAGFDNQDTTSVLQVVDNPGWLIPYVSCILVSVGLLWHFSLHLLRHLNQRGKA